MDSNAARAHWLAGLAEHLAAKRPAILKAWRAYVDADPELTTPASLPRVLFNDHIPDLFEAFGSALGPPANRSVDADPERTGDGAAHGLQRWQQGYRPARGDARVGHPAACVPTSCTSTQPPITDVGPVDVGCATAVLVRALHAWASETAPAKYFQLEQIEARGNVRDLEQDAQPDGAQERERAALVAEAAHDLRGNLGWSRRDGHEDAAGRYHEACATFFSAAPEQ